MCVAIVVAVAVGTPVALAEGPVLADTPDLPWSDPEHQSSTERLASEVASGIAGRPVRVFCLGIYDWDTFGRDTGVDSAKVWGFVVPPRACDPVLGVWKTSATNAYLSPTTCDRLWRFGRATRKPTVCEATRTALMMRETQVVTTVVGEPRASVLVRATVAADTRRGATAGETQRKRLTVRTTTEVKVAVAPVPCYPLALDGALKIAAPAVGWVEFATFAEALLSLAHESVHLRDLAEGQPIERDRAVSEARAECHGIQLVARVAEAFGAGADDAAGVAHWLARELYPTLEAGSPEYWSPECRSGGALDLTPAEDNWP